MPWSPGGTSTEKAKSGEGSRTSVMRLADAISVKSSEKTGESPNIATPLEELSKDFVPIDYEMDEDFGVSLDDFVSPENNDVCRRMDGVFKDKWNFAETLTESQRSELKECLESVDIWDGIGCLNTGEFLHMPLKPEYIGKQSIQDSYSMSAAKREAYDKIEHELEENDVIEDSQVTDFCSPAMIVIQHGKPRMVIDFRKVNDMCMRDVYPIPRQKDVFPKLQDAEYISSFDMKKSFFQFPIHPDDRDKTTFKTRHRGAKRMKRSVMGYLNSASHCQRIMDRMIKPYKWIFVIVYLDNIIIFSKTWEDHLKHISIILSKVKGLGLTLDPGKAFVGFKSLNVLGHLINRFGLGMQQSKIRAMLDLREPKTVKEVMQVVNFFGYYREFIRGFAMIMNPITSLLSTGSKESPRIRLQQSVEWGLEQAAAFSKVKEKLKEAVYLSHAFDGENVQFKLYVDACKIGMGAALHVIVPENRMEGQHPSQPLERPVTFISRSLKASEKNFWPTELEMAGLVWALRQLEETIEGRKLEIYTDHAALLWLFRATNSKTRHNQRLFLWAMALEKYKPYSTIVHRAGRAHVNADVLSQYPVDMEFPDELRKSLDPSVDAPPMKDDFDIDAIASCSFISDQFRSKIVAGYQDDKHWKTLYAKLSSDSDTSKSDVEYHSYRFEYHSKLLYYVDPRDKSAKLCIPLDCFKEILSLEHDHAGHSGFAKTYDRLSQNFHTSNMSRTVKSYVDGCRTCQASKNRDKRTGLLHPLEIPSQPCDDICMDFVNGLPKHAEFDAILTMTDKFSKLVTLIPCQTSDSAEKTAERVLRHYYTRFGLPMRIVSDRDVRFTSRFWQELFRRLKVPLLMSTAHAPQTDGASKRTNQSMEVMLRCIIGYQNRDWVEELPFVEFYINSQTASGTGSTPFQLLYGFTP